MAERPEDQRLNPADPRALAFATDIDRRKCQRVVPLKLMCFGLSRTGTTSLRQALIDLGYRDCYHYSAVLNENPRDADMWVEALEAKYMGKGKPFTKKDWDQLLGHCMAITDNPCTRFIPELLEAYPEAKIIVTVRDSPEQWIRSFQRTLIFYKNLVVDRPNNLKGLFLRLFGPSPDHAQDPTAPKLDRLHYLTTRIDPSFTATPEEARRIYAERIEDIKRRVPAENLLIFNVKEGWKPLCDFLGVKEVPSWEFPRKNEGDSFRVHILRLHREVMQAAVRNALKKLALTSAIVGCVWLAVNPKSITQLVERWGR